MKGATPAPTVKIRSHQRRRQWRMALRVWAKKLVDRVFPTVGFDDLPPSWEPPIDNSVRMQDYQRRIKQTFDKEAA